MYLYRGNWYHAITLEDIEIFIDVTVKFLGNWYPTIARGIRDRVKTVNKNKKKKSIEYSEMKESFKHKIHRNMLIAFIVITNWYFTTKRDFQGTCQLCEHRHHMQKYPLSRPFQLQQDHFLTSRFFTSLV